MYASAIGVTRLVAPGPEVAMHTPTRPVAAAWCSTHRQEPSESVPSNCGSHGTR